MWKRIGADVIWSSATGGQRHLKFGDQFDLQYHTDGDLAR